MRTLIVLVLLAGCTIQPIKSSSEANAASEAAAAAVAAVQASQAQSSQHTSQASQGTTSQPIIIICNQLNAGRADNARCIESADPSKQFNKVIK